MASLPELLTKYAQDHNLKIETVTQDNIDNHYITDKPDTSFGYDKTYDGNPKAFTWGLPDTHSWVKICNDNNHPVDIF